jgi:hypothetical protein
VAADWQGRTFHAWYDRPLLLLAALRADALAEGATHPLHAAFAATPADPVALDRDRLAAGLGLDRERVHEALRRRTVQTNETSRAVAWLWPAALAGLGTPERPLALADLGASAGLNLVADLLPSPWTDEAGAPLPVARDVVTVARVGLDLSPLDAADPGDALWLRACIWPGEEERERRLLAALAAFASARIREDAPVLLPISAHAIPERLERLAFRHRGATVLAYQSLVRDFLGAGERRAYEAGMREWVAGRPAGRALWVELELAGGRPEESASIVAHLRARDGAVRTLALGRCSPHPTRVERDLAAVAELVYITSPPSTSTQRPSK